jgi:hypothetical protein
MFNFANMFPPHLFGDMWQRITKTAPVEHPFVAPRIHRTAAPWVNHQSRYNRLRREARKAA